MTTLDDGAVGTMATGKPGRHVGAILGIAGLVVGIILYPFLPGRHDPLALPLSTVVQAGTMAAAPLIPVGLWWLAWRTFVDGRGQARGPVERRFAMTALLVAIVPAAVMTLVAFATAGTAAGLGALGLLAVCFSLAFRRGRNLTDQVEPHPAPWYLVAIPAVAIAGQLVLAGPATDFGRRRAIANGAELIRDLERHRATNGHYPASLLAVWPDYSPSVVGIERYHYAPIAEDYQVAFEQPRFLFDDLGAREFVVYRPGESPIMASHAAWITLWAPARLAASQGWYAARPAGPPDWTSLLFD